MNQPGMSFWRWNFLRRPSTRSTVSITRRSRRPCCTELLILGKPQSWRLNPPVAGRENAVLG